MIPIAIRADARYRIVEESRMLDMLVLCGWARELRRGEHEPSVAAARAALERWIRAGLPFAPSGDGARRFDPAEVLNFMKYVGQRDGDPFWEERFVATGRAMILEFHGLTDTDMAPPPPTSLPGARFAVTFEREFDLGAVAPGARILLRLPLPLADVSLRDLKIRPIAPPGADVDFTLEAGRLDARLRASSRNAITIGVQLSFTAHPTVPSGPAAVLSTADVELYTRPSEGLIKVSPRIRALAAELADAEHDSERVLRRLWDFMLEHFTIGALHYDELDPSRPTDWPLETGRFDCQMGSALLVALCRARGIPARLVSGYLLYAASPSQHYWAEIWTDSRGWVPVDTICSDLSVWGRDACWRDYFFGALDPRMKTQYLPRLFNHNPAMPFPRAWHMLSKADGDGIEIAFFANDTGALVYRDRISARREAEAVDSLSPAAPRRG
jgi:Transglutaminase-like superfamily